MNMLTSSSSLSLTSWPASSSSSSLNSVSGSFVSNLNQISPLSYVNQPGFHSLCIESNIQPNIQPRQQRPITAQHNFHTKQKQIQVVPSPAHIQALAPAPFTNNSIMFQSKFSQLSAITTAKYSRKVFVGGLPPDIDQDEIVSYFSAFGQVTVDWPHKSETKSVFPPKGYVFLIFEKEKSVQELMNSCQVDKDKYYLTISSQSIKEKPVQIRPWCLNDADYMLTFNQPIDPRKTIFVGGVPRPLKSVELAMIMERLYGGVCYAGIDTDPELKYPKGAARVSFSNHQSYVAAISARFVQLHQGEIDKRAEVKPYVLDDQPCDLCSGTRCGGKSAPFFCANIACLQYYCETCWETFHSKPGRDFHKPLVKEGADRPRTIPFRWC